MAKYTAEADTLLRKADERLAELAALHRLPKSTSRTLWRWDEPTATMTWTDLETGVGRSLQVEITDSGFFSVGLSAWKDFDEGPPRRLWNGVTLTGEFDIDSLAVALARAFEKVSAWTERDLKKSAPRLKVPT